MELNYSKKSSLEEMIFETIEDCQNGKIVWKEDAHANQSIGYVNTEPKFKIVLVKNFGAVWESQLFVVEKRQWTLKETLNEGAMWKETMKKDSNHANKNYNKLSYQACQSIAEMLLNN